jgi:hypothetical protein
MEQIEADLEAENPWARIIKLVDLQTEHSDGSNDVSRMRQIFIQLKNVSSLVAHHEHRL